MSSQKILVVDDEVGIREGLRSSLELLGFDVSLASTGEDALLQIRNSDDISFVISDYRMPGKDGFDVLNAMKKKSPETPVVMMTGYSSVNNAVKAMRMGADDYLCKPFSIDDLEKVIQKSKMGEAEETPTAILSQDQNFIHLLQKTQRAAKSTAPILIEGESGTGKELLARQIHFWSDRREKPWVAINCAALPAGLLESELFGFEKGAFTGAMERKPGKFEQAEGGTLLLDEIGELDPMLQAKLLRVLQEGEIDRLGGRQPLKINVRILATTNKNLEQLVREGKFREDLFFRLYGVRFTLPSIRDRRDDIELLANEFLKRQSESQNRDLSFETNVMESLRQMNWPGNVRQLERAVERAAILSDSPKIGLSNFEFTDPQVARKVDVTLREVTSNKSIKDMEREIILSALDQHQGNRTHTAKALGMSLRTLRHKLKQYRDSGLDVDASRQDLLGKNALASEVTQGS